MLNEKSRLASKIKLKILNYIPNDNKLLYEIIELKLRRIFGRLTHINDGGVMHTVLEFEELAREFLDKCGGRGEEVRELLWKAQKLVIYLEIRIEKFYGKFGVKGLIENKFEIKKQWLGDQQDFATIAGYNYQMFAHLDSDLTKFEFENFSIEGSSKGGMLTLPRKIENELSDDEGYLKKIANIKHFESKEFNFLSQLIKNFLRNCQGDSDPASEKNFLCGRGATVGKLRTVLC